MVVAAGPVVPGWLAQVTPPSVQLPLTRNACSVRPLRADEANRRSVADWTTHPSGITMGIPNRTSTRLLLPGFDMTFIVESVPLLSDGLPWLIQASADAVYVCVEAVHCNAGGGGCRTSQVWTAGLASTLPAVSTARTANECNPVKPLRCTGDVHGAHSPSSS